MKSATKKTLSDYLYFKGKIIIWQNDFTISEPCDRDYSDFVREGIDKLAIDKKEIDDISLFKSLEFRELDSKFEAFIYQWMNLTKRNNEFATELGENTLMNIRNIVCPFYPFC
jgi:hypothetical protein